MKVALTYIALRLANFLTFIAYMRLHRQSWTHVFYRWDAQWYDSVATHGYNYVSHDKGRSLSNEAFFPLFPYLEKLVSKFTSFSYIESGILISGISGLVAALMIYKSVELFNSESVAFLTVVIWALLPISYVQMLSYSETIFTALCATALYFSLKKSFLRAAFCASFAGLTRPSGMAVSVAVMVATFLYIRRHRYSRRDPAAVLAIFVAPLGWLSFVGFLAIKHHNIFAYFQIQRNWNNGFDGGLHFLQWIWKQLSHHPFTGLLLVLGVVFVVLLLVAAIKGGQPTEVLIFSAAIVFISFTTSGYFGSKPRYLMPAFPLLIPIAHWLARKGSFQRRLLLTIFGTVGMAASVITLAGNGPP